MKKQLNQLKGILQQELALENELKKIKKEKEAILKNLDTEMLSDTYSTDFCTIMRVKKFKIEVINKRIDLSRFYETKLNEKLIVDEFEATGAVKGVKIKKSYSLQIRKKKNGFDREV